MLYVEDLVKELEKLEPINFDDEKYFDNQADPAYEIYQGIIDRLPNVWKDNLDWTEIEIATNGDEILFKHEVDCEKIGDLIDEHLFDCHTGYYDPYEDARNGETDANSGWYYLDLA